MLEPLSKQVVCCVQPINDTDLANMQIRTLTQGLEMYSVKQDYMNS